MDFSIFTKLKYKSYHNQFKKMHFVHDMYSKVQQCMVIVEYISCAQTNTFQCILTTDKNQAYAIFQYADGLIQWTTGDATGGSGGYGGTPAQVGFNAGDSRSYANVQDSRTPAIINITRTSNVLVPGQWIFSVHNARISAGMARCKN